jgi:hypothetical protein
MSKKQLWTNFIHFLCIFLECLETPRKLAIRITGRRRNLSVRKLDVAPSAAGLGKVTCLFSTFGVTIADLLEIKYQNYQIFRLKKIIVPEIHILQNSALVEIILFQNTCQNKFQNRNSWNVLPEVLMFDLSLGVSRIF